MTRSLLFLLVFSSMCAGEAWQANAGLIDNSTVSILPSSTAAFPDWSQADAIDIGPNQYVSDYASAGLGISTHLDFAFPTNETFSQIVYTNRTTSGSGNNGFNGGTSDYVYKYEYIFSNDPTFATNVGTVTVTLPDPGISSLPTVADFQSTDAIPNFTAQYLRWQVLGTNGSNPGAANFNFFSASIPEPSSIVLFGMGAAVLAVHCLRQRSQSSTRVVSSIRNE